MKTYLNVIVRFEIKEEQLDILVSLIRNFFAKEVSSFPGFVSFKLHANKEGTVLINYATWESMEHFQKFTAFAGVSESSKKIREFQPRADSVYEILLS